MIKLFFSGAAYDGADQVSPRACLGGHRSSTEIIPLRPLFVNSIRGVSVVRVSGACGAGSFEIQPSVNRYLRFVPPLSAAGQPVRIDRSGGSFRLFGPDPNKFADVTVSRGAELFGNISGTLAWPLDGAICCGNLNDDQARAGGREARCVILRAIDDVEDITAQIDCPTAGVTYSVGWCVPEVRVYGYARRIASPSDAPGWVAWNNTISLDALNRGENYGLWILREWDAGVGASAREYVTLTVAYKTRAGAQRHEKFREFFRIENRDFDRYEVFVGVNEEPRFDSPVAVSASLPVDIPLPPPASGHRDYYVVVRRRNRYGLTSLNRAVRRFRVLPDSSLVPDAPSGPESVSLEDVGGGRIRLRATANKFSGAVQPTHWVVYSSVGANQPELLESPEIIEIGDSWRATVELERVFGPYEFGSRIWVLVRTRSAVSGGESDNVAFSTTRVLSQRPSAPRSVTRSVGEAATVTDDRAIDAGPGYAVVNRSRNRLVALVTNNGEIVLRSGFSLERNIPGDDVVGAPAKTYVLAGDRYSTGGSFRVRGNGLRGDDTPVFIVDSDGLVLATSGISTNSGDDRLAITELGIVDELDDGECVEWRNQDTGVRVAAIDSAGMLWARAGEFHARYEQIEHYPI